jgi:hypothetical protein
MTTSTQLGFTFLTDGQSQGEITANAMFQLLDAHVHLSVKDKDLSIPPVSPAAGAWFGWTGYIAVYNNGWIGTAPKEGWLCWADDENHMFRYDGTNWKMYGTAKEFRSVSVKSPATTDAPTIMYSSQSMTITAIYAAVRGSATPNCTWTLKKGTDRSAAGTEVITGGTSTTATTTPATITSFTSATIPAGRYLWLEIPSAPTGTVNELLLTIEYEEL